jgi:two-component system nitrate/nitrite sensor histidine kinase NarX
MAYLKLQSAQMQSALRQGDLPRLEQMMKNNYQTLSEAYLDTRQAIDNLRITPQKGLATWLENLSTDFETAAGMQIKRSFAPLSHEIMPEIEAQLIRIVQEALSNIRKHAQAQRAWVTLREWEGDLILEIGDDGRGFFPEDVPLVSQYGLRGMRERAELIGADFQIISQPHQGTLVRLRLPLHLQEYSA